MHQIYLRISLKITTYPHFKGVVSPFIQQIVLNCYRGTLRLELADSEKFLTIFWFKTINNKFKCQFCVYTAV